MNTVDGFMSLRVGTVNGDDIMSPSRSGFNWNDGILTSECSRKNLCEAGHPAQDCTCGIYSVLENGLNELNNYIGLKEHVVFVGWAFSTVHLYEWGLRSGQWVAVGVVNWHGLYDQVISPDNVHQPWWDSAYSALDILRTRHVEKPKLYEMETVSKAIRQQINIHNERNNAFNQLFGIKQQEKHE
jgi:hypothetical protein